MTEPVPAGITVITCGPPPTDWVESLKTQARDLAIDLAWIELPPAIRLDQSVARLAHLTSPRVLLAPRGSQVGGGICALTLVRLVTPLPVLEWHPDQLVETLDTAQRILALVSPSAPGTAVVPPSPAPQPAAQATTPLASPGMEVPPVAPTQPGPTYARQRRIRVRREDYDLPNTYEEQLRTRTKPTEEKPPPPPIPLSQIMQSGLARAGARVRQDPAVRETILPADLMLALLDLTGGALHDVLTDAGQSASDLSSALESALGLPPLLQEEPASSSPRRAVMPDSSLTDLLNQTRREGRSRGATVASSRDFLRSVIAGPSELRQALADCGLNLDLARELMDERHYPDPDESDPEELHGEPVAQPGWTDPLAGLDPLTRREVEEHRQHQDSEWVLDPTPAPPSQPPTPQPVPPPTEASREEPLRRSGRPQTRLRRLTLYNPEMPSPEMVDAVTELLRKGRMVLFPSDLGLHALVRLDMEEPASQLLRYRRGLQLPGSEVLIHSLRAARDFPTEVSLRRHSSFLDQLGDFRAAVRLPWQRRHGAIDALDEDPRTGWHRGWRIPAHTALLAILADLNQPVLALSASQEDPGMDALIHHDSQPLAMAVSPSRILAPQAPAILDLRGDVPRLEHPGHPSEDAVGLRAWIHPHET